MASTKASNDPAWCAEKEAQDPSKKIGRTGRLCSALEKMTMSRLWSLGVRLPCILAAILLSHVIYMTILQKSRLVVAISFTFFALTCELVGHELPYKNP